MPDETSGFHFPVVFGGVVENDVAIFHMPSRGKSSVLQIIGVKGRKSMAKIAKLRPKVHGLLLWGVQSKAQRHECQEA